MYINSKVINFKSTENFTIITNESTYWRKHGIQPTKMCDKVVRENKIHIMIKK